MGTTGYRDTFIWRLYDRMAQLTDQHIGWDRLPTALGLAVLVGLRNVLRRRNLHDTAGLESKDGAQPVPSAAGLLTERAPDGSHNDLAHPEMGMAGTRFGRNFPLDKVDREPDADLLSPNPRLVSRELMTRHEFIPATSINLLVAAWIQFMVKDWMSHGRGDREHSYTIPLAADDLWPKKVMAVLKTLTDPTRPPDSGRPRTFLNHQSPWWDASQVYGGGTEPTDKLERRTGHGGHLVIGEDGRLVLPDDERSPAHTPGWWLGLEMMGTVFVLEHNAIADALHRKYPTWSDGELYQRARLINASLIAKIHTVEWTPAIISHPTTVAALRVNWWGLAGERVRRLLGRISSSEVISGIPGGRADHFGVPYSLTEEFAIVYRMHPLIPDNYTFRSLEDDAVLAQRSFREIEGPHSHDVAISSSLGDLFYSFGISHPGALVLNNYPQFLQEFERPDNGELMDLATTDILRTRELGVPRYNEFRRLLHRKPVRSFEELVDDPRTVRSLKQIYDGDVEKIDTIVGMFAEKKPEGFGFSDTAFRIFILMAARRLNSDRFLTSDFTAEVYTPLGIDWVQNTTMVDVLVRHFPELRPALRGLENAFVPWTPVSEAMNPSRP